MSSVCARVSLLGMFMFLRQEEGADRGSLPGSRTRFAIILSGCLEKPRHGRGWTCSLGVEGLLTNAALQEGNMAERRNRRRFTAEFKAEAVRPEPRAAQHLAQPAPGGGIHGGIGRPQGGA